MNAADHQRADDLERVLDEGAVGRAVKMAKNWSTAHAQVALAEVHRRNDAHRQQVIASGSDAGVSAVDVQRFSQRDDELVSVRTKLDD